MGLKKKKKVFDHETQESGLFPCHRLKINDFLSSYKPNLKIDMFTHLQQIPCYCKSSLGTLRLISWWRVTFAALLRLDDGAEGLVTEFNAVMTETTEFLG